MELIVLRGCSGSGKSTKAKELMKDFLNQNPNRIVSLCSADNFFKDSVTGKYQFDHTKLGNAHGWCKSEVRKAMKHKTDLVILDNTNTQLWEYQPYLDLAKEFGYNTQEIVVGKFDETSLEKYAARNIHGVPLKVIKKMALRFEKSNG